jgi:hypothetical protein
LIDWQDARKFYTIFLDISYVILLEKDDEVTESIHLNLSEISLAGICLDNSIQLGEFVPDLLVVTKLALFKNRFTSIPPKAFEMKALRELILVNNFFF